MHQGFILHGLVAVSSLLSVALAWSGTIKVSLHTADNEGAGSKGEYIYVEFPQLGVVERFQEGTDFEVNAWCTRAFDFTNVAYPTHFKITNHFNDDVIVLST